MALARGHRDGQGATHFFARSVIATRTEDPCGAQAHIKAAPQEFEKTGHESLRGVGVNLAALVPLASP